MAKAPAFRTGVDIIEETGKSANRRFQRDNFFGLDDGEECIIRFVTEADPRQVFLDADGNDTFDNTGNPKLDEDGDPVIELGWITVDQYGFLPTKDAPKNYKGKSWPKSMPAVSRSDPAFAGMFEDDYVAEHMRDSKGQPYRPSQRYWALACLREEVREGGRVVGYKDKTREVEVPGKDGGASKTITEKDIVVVNMAYGNFFSILTGFVKQYGTALDRDYHIRRKGSGPSDTEYKITPLDRIPVGDDSPGYEGTDGRRYYDLRDPEIAKRYEYPTPLWEIVLARASDEYYERFFDQRVVLDDGDDDDEGGSKGSKGAPAKQQVKPVDEPDADRLAALKNRVMDYDESPTESPADDDAAPAPSSGGLRNFDDD